MKSWRFLSLCFFESSVGVKSSPKAELTIYNSNTWESKHQWCNLVWILTCDGSEKLRTRREEEEEEDRQLHPSVVVPLHGRVRVGCSAGEDRTHRYETRQVSHPWSGDERMNARSCRVPARRSGCICAARACCDSRALGVKQRRRRFQGEEKEERGEGKWDPESYFSSPERRKCGAFNSLRSYGFVYLGRVEELSFAHY